MARLTLGTLSGLNSFQNRQLIASQDDLVILDSEMKSTEDFAGQFTYVKVLHVAAQQGVTHTKIDSVAADVEAGKLETHELIQSASGAAQASSFELCALLKTAEKDRASTHRQLQSLSKQVAALSARRPSQRRCRRSPYSSPLKASATVKQLADQFGNMNTAVDVVAEAVAEEKSEESFAADDVVVADATLDDATEVYGAEYVIEAKREQKRALADAEEQISHFTFMN
jgi:hypothetical protein